LKNWRRQQLFNWKGRQGWNLFNPAQTYVRLHVIMARLQPPRRCKNHRPSGHRKPISHPACLRFRRYDPT